MHEEDENQEALTQQAARQRARDEAAMIRAVFLGTRMANAVKGDGKTFAYTQEDVWKYTTAMEE